MAEDTETTMDNEASTGEPHGYELDDSHRTSYEPNSSQPKGYELDNRQLQGYELTGSQSEGYEHADSQSRDHEFNASQPEGYARPLPQSRGDVAGERRAYVRQRTPHLTQPPVDDLKADEAYDHGFSHESSYTLNRRHIPGGTYRRSRSQISRAQKELRYGQYLSVPKGSHEIFGKRERIRRKQIAVVVIAIVAIVVVVAIFLSMPR